MSQIAGKTLHGALDQAIARKADLPQKRQCEGLKRDGTRCGNWALTGDPHCVSHSERGRASAVEARRTRAKARQEARQTVAERAAASLDDDWPKVLGALRRGLDDKSAAVAARTAISYVQLVFGRQLQVPQDESQSQDPLDVSQMTRAERDALKRRLLAQDPALGERLRAVE